MMGSVASTPEKRLAMVAESTIQPLDAILAVGAFYGSERQIIDASLPFNETQRGVLKKACDISFAQDSLLYIALNKVDLVTPKDLLIEYANSVSSVVWKKKIELVYSVGDGGGNSRIESECDAEAEGVGERGAVYDIGAAEGWRRRHSRCAGEQSEAGPLEGKKGSGAEEAGDLERACQRDCPREGV